MIVFGVAGAVGASDSQAKAHSITHQEVLECAGQGAPWLLKVKPYARWWFPL